MRRKLIAGNWKMNMDYKSSDKLAKELIAELDKNMFKKTDVVVCPSYVSLGIVNKTIKDSEIRLGAQNLFYENDGAFTGEISASMLKAVGCEYVIIGHSERRISIHDTNETINKKLKKALEFELKPILCVGESLVEREDDIFEGVIEEQLMECLKDIPEDEFKNIVIAYEPVWAIGTGLNASPKQASDIHAFIRKVILGLYSAVSSEELQILYGGSVNEKNSKEMISAAGIDGALVGGASLKVNDFVSIIKTASETK
ncbi:MAG: triose-phosphate isomerase [Ignavibacteria bacterium]